MYCTSFSIHCIFNHFWVLHIICWWGLTCTWIICICVYSDSVGGASARAMPFGSIMYYNVLEQTFFNFSKKDGCIKTQLTQLTYNNYKAENFDEFFENGGYDVKILPVKFINNYRYFD